MRMNVEECTCSIAPWRHFFPDSTEVYILLHQEALENVFRMLHCLDSGIREEAEMMRISIDLPEGIGVPFAEQANRTRAEVRVVTMEDEVCVESNHVYIWNWELFILRIVSNTSTGAVEHLIRRLMTLLRKIDFIQVHWTKEPVGTVRNATWGIGRVFVLLHRTRSALVLAKIGIGDLLGREQISSADVLSGGRQREQMRLHSVYKVKQNKWLHLISIFLLRPPPASTAAFSYHASPQFSIEFISFFRRIFDIWWYEPRSEKLIW